MRPRFYMFLDIIRAVQVGGNTCFMKYCTIIVQLHTKNALL